MSRFWLFITFCEIAIVAILFAGTGDALIFKGLWVHRLYGAIAINVAMLTSIVALIAGAFGQRTVWGTAIASLGAVACLASVMIFSAATGLLLVVTLGVESQMVLSSPAIEKIAMECLSLMPENPVPHLNLGATGLSLAGWALVTLSAFGFRRRSPEMAPFQPGTHDFP